MRNYYLSKSIWGKYDKVCIINKLGRGLSLSGGEINWLV